MKYTDLAIREPQHLCVFGDPKSGKSTLVSELAIKHKLIWISIDGGHSVLSKLPPAAQDNIDIIVIPDTRSAAIAQQTCRELWKGKPVSVCHMHGMVGCNVCRQHNLGFNSYELNRLDLNTIVVLDHASRLTESYVNNITKDKPDDYKLQLDDYGALKYHLGAFFSYVQTSPFNSVTIAQLADVKMEDKSSKLCPDIGSSSFAPVCGQYFDHMIYTHVMNNTHRAGSSTTYKASVMTGSRSDISIEKGFADTGVLDLEPFFSEAPLVAESNQHTQRILINASDALKATAPSKQLDTKAITKGAEPVIANERVAAILAARRGK